MKYYKHYTKCTKCNIDYGYDNPKDNGLCPRHDKRFIRLNKYFKRKGGAHEQI